jgi:hypothetical protein
VSDSDNTEVVTLAGLRRLVLHARDMLAKAPAPSGYLDSAAVQQWAAAQTARSVLTLVADCLPGQSMTEDEAAQLRAATDARIAGMEAKVRKAVAERDVATKRAEDASGEGFDAVNAQLELESSVADLLGLDADADVYAALEERIAAKRAGDGPSEELAVAVSGDTGKDPE